LLPFLPRVTEIADMRGPLIAGGLYRDPLPVQKKWISNEPSRILVVYCRFSSSFCPPRASFMLRSFSTLSFCHQEFLKSVILLHKLAFWKVKYLPEYTHRTHVSLLCCYLLPSSIMFQQNEVSHGTCHYSSKAHNTLERQEQGGNCYLILPRDWKLHMSSFLLKYCHWFWPKSSLQNSYKPNRRLDFEKNLMLRYRYDNEPFPRLPPHHHNL